MLNTGVAQDESKIREIRVKADTWFEAGQQYYNLLGPKWLKGQYNVMKSVLKAHGFWAKLELDIEEDAIIEIIQRLSLPEVLDFIKGGAQSKSVQEAGLSEYDLHFLNNPYFLTRIARTYTTEKVSTDEAMGCTFLGLTDQVHGSGTARNFDFIGAEDGVNFPKIQSTYLVSLYLTIEDKKYPNEIFMPSPAGCIQNVTVTNHLGLMAETNTLQNLSIATDLTTLTRKDILSELVVLMTQVSSFEDLKHRVLNIPIDTPLFINITGPGFDQMASISMLPENKMPGAQKNFKNFIRVSSSQNTKEPTIDYNPGQLLACANDQRQVEEMKKYTKGKADESSGFFTLQRYLNAVYLGKKFKDEFTQNPLATLKQILELELNNTQQGFTVPQHPKAPFNTDKGLTQRSVAFVNYFRLKSANHTGPSGAWRAQVEDGWTDWKDIKFKSPKV